MGLVVGEKIIDFSQSYLSWQTKAEQSFGRFALESSCYIKNLQSGEDETFSLATGVMAGNVYADDNLVKVPTYLFQIAASEDHYQIFRDYAVWEGNKDSAGRNREIFSSLTIRQNRVLGKIVTGLSEIAEGASSGAIFNGKIRFASDSMAYQLEFPVKHMNIQCGNKNFQIETGPILVPQCTLFDYVPIVNRTMFSRAYVFFNQLNNAEFILDVPVGRTAEPKFRFFSKVKTIECEILLSIPKKQ